MSERYNLELISRRRAFSFLGSAAAALSVAVPATVLIATDAEARVGNPASAVSVAGANRRDRRDDRRNKKKKKKWSFPYPLDSRAGYIGPVCCRCVLFRVHVAACAVWLSYPGLLPGVFVTDQADMQAVDERVREFRQVRCNDPS
jgi:hypothetical protein